MKLKLETIKKFNNYENHYTIESECCNIIHILTSKSIFLLNEKYLLNEVSVDILISHNNLINYHNLINADITFFIESGKISLNHRDFGDDDIKYLRYYFFKTK